MIVHLNIRSLINKIDLIRLLLADRNIDCLCLTETWLKPIITNDLLCIQGYNCLRVDRNRSAGSNRGGGICVYLREDYEPTFINFSEYNQDDVELLCFKFSGKNTGSVICTTVYRPPRGNVDKALSCIGKLVQSLGDPTPQNVVIHGDLNINYNNNQCKWVKKLKGWEIKVGLKQVIRSNTRITKDSGTLIDHCFTNLLNLNTAGTLNLNVSDHLATFLVKKKIREEKRRKIFKGRNYRSLTWDAIGDHLKGNLVLRKGDGPDAIWQTMESEFIRVADELCPVRIYDIKK